MSLDDEQRRRTGAELREHAEAAGLSNEEIAAAAGLTPDVVAAVLVMGAVSPVDVWAVRDVLDAECAQRGLSMPWSVLTDSARTQAVRWFGLRDVR